MSLINNMRELCVGGYVTNNNLVLIIRLIPVMKCFKKITVMIKYLTW